MTEHSRDLPCDRTSPRQARAWTTAILDDELQPRELVSHLRDDAVLVASELATSALLGGCTSMSLHLAVHPDHVRMALVDSAAPAVALLDAAFQAQWQGLRLIDAIARDWGVTPLGSGREVWVELARAT